MLKRTLIKRKSSSLKPIGPIRRKSKSKEDIDAQKEQSMKLWELYDEHWQLRKHSCEQCDVLIWGENKSLYHHHLLEKANPKYKHLMYEINNLMILCGNCHSAVTSGFPGEKIKERTNKIKKELGYN